ncbi:hypothetical protein [Desulfonatronum thiodismutans]|uniref:hypothetical protein n=1 Tax=Desulfonatronum thiodismutans TaxID=159290 RepID=UPI0004ABE0EB|nr:hypothetical protein [Desulfonatronum thiodismutans]
MSPKESKDSMVVTDTRSTSFSGKGQQPPQRLLGMALFIGLALLLSAACAPRVTQPPKPAPLLTEQTPFGPSMTLAEMLDQSLRTQYRPPNIDFPVPDQMAHSSSALPQRSGDYFMELSRESVTLHLASDVTAYVLGPSASSSGEAQARGQTDDIPEAGLAVGHANGDIHVWSSWPCASLTLPTAAPVTLLTWDGVGPFLGAGNARSGELHAFDLRHCARVGTVPGQHPLRHAALSSSSTWVAVTDTGQRLFVGPLGELFANPSNASPVLEQDPRRHVGTLRFPPLALAFSPREGLLQSVDQAGWLLLWTLPDLTLLEQVRIPGGPFGAALFHGGHLILGPAGIDQDVSPTSHDESRPEPVIWDIPNSRAVAAEEILTSQNASSTNQGAPWALLHFFERFNLDAGLLTFRTAQKHWLRKLHFGTPRLSVHAADDDGLLRVTEPDQTQRWYQTATGRPADAPDHGPTRLTPLAVAPDGTVSWNGRTYALADPVQTRDGYVLMARHVPEHRFFLWWMPVEEVRVSMDSWILPDKTDLLPIRNSLIQDSPPSWISLSDHRQPVGDMQ